MLVVNDKQSMDWDTNMTYVTDLWVKIKSLTKVRLNPQINQRKTGKNGKRSQHQGKRLKTTNYQGR
jgi:hypothetical protein